MAVLYGPYLPLSYIRYANGWLRATEWNGEYITPASDEEQNLKEIEWQPRRPRQTLASALAASREPSTTLERKKARNTVGDARTAATR